MFEFGPTRYRPEKNFIRSSEIGYRIDQQFYASLIGLLAISLPLLMMISAYVTGCFYDSISHFYYAKFFGDVLVAILVFIGAFLLAYRGLSRGENTLATIAGIGTIIVALIPTSKSGVEIGYCSGRAFFQADGSNLVMPEFELFSGAIVYHLIGATILFSFLAYYSLNVFTRPENPHLPATPTKKLRNVFYVASGLTIIGCMAAIGLKFIVFKDEWNFWGIFNLTFWFETGALWAFGFSWIVKGRVFGQAFQDQIDKNTKPNI